MSPELAERIAETKRVQDANIAAAKRSPRYSRAFATVHRLNKNGWTIRVWDADTGLHVGFHGAKVGPHLSVDGTDNHGDEFTGSIGQDGSLCGEPLD